MVKHQMGTAKKGKNGFQSGLVWQISGTGSPDRTGSETEDRGYKNRMSFEKGFAANRITAFSGYDFILMG